MQRAGSTNIVAVKEFSGQVSSVKRDSESESASGYGASCKSRQSSSLKNSKIISNKQDAATLKRR